MAEEGRFVKNFVIVEFIKRGSLQKIKMIDTVPKSWIHVGANLTSYFPPENQWDQLPWMVSHLNEPEQFWERCRIKCRYNTDEYEVAEQVMEAMETYGGIPEDRQDIIDRLGYQGEELEWQIRMERLVDGRNA